MQGTVLIADGQATNRILLKARLAPAQYLTVQASTVEEALSILRGRRTELALIGSDLPGGGAKALCRAMRDDPALRLLPTLVIADRLTGEDRLGYLDAGADEVMERSIDTRVLMARIRSLVRDSLAADTGALDPAATRALGFAEAATGFQHPADVALVTPDCATAALWQGRLRPRVPARLRAGGYRDFLGTILRGPAPDVVAIGLGADEAEAGLRLLADLRARSATRSTVILAVLDRPDATLAADALDLGASDLMLEGFAADELALRLKARIAAKQALDHQRAQVQTGLRAAVVDPMTGLFNRRYALPALADALDGPQPPESCIAAILADLDHFKTVNDGYGHAAGDAVLIEAARRMQAATGPGDIVARVGGEEFLIVLRLSAASEAAPRAEALRKAIGARAFAVPGVSDPIAITISLGVALADESSRGDAGAERLFNQADRALYDAKRDGRNRVAVVSAAA